jgi:hypothetical protein
LERRNCWEVKKCGREPGGKNSKELGVCPATLPNEYDGVNRGTHAGRFCWAVAGTLCKGEMQGTYAKKLMSCLNCGFLNQVNEDEGRNFILVPQKAKSES